MRKLPWIVFALMLVFAILYVTNTAPASSAPRRRTAPKTPSLWQRRRYAATHMLDFNRMDPTIGQRIG